MWEAIFSNRKFEETHAVHNGQKDHKCDSCEKLFSQAGNLKKHIDEVHNGQKDHKCDYCGNLFSRVGNLKKHIYLAHMAQRITNVTFVEVILPKQDTWRYILIKTFENV